MFRDGHRIEDRAVARRQAFSTSTYSPSVTTSSSSYSSEVTSIPISHTRHAVASSALALETLTGTESSPESYCTVALPSGGIIRFNESYAIALGETLSFQAPCANNSVFSEGNSTSSGNSTVIPFSNPFYSSISPQVYALATATVLSYLLVIILLITPRTFFVGGPSGSNAHSGGASGLLGRGITFMGSGSSNSSVIGVGRRPLLQKIAAITVAISLTIATADTFKVAEQQYDNGYMDAHALVDEVVYSLEVRVTRVISDTFLWLAQVQTLIRLFPRHKEKVTIKWLGFLMVVCDTVFSILENFVSQDTRSTPETFTDAIPALSYLFEMAISLIYASCVAYYSISKHRFAFWNSKMKSMCIMALLSLISVTIPVVFFVVDVSQPDVATWGEYIRWVGAAAASVVVWEWVERIEALERDEKKDGILGREIFDGDEMLENITSDSTGSNRGMHFGAHRDAEDHNEKRPIWKDLRDLNLRARIMQIDWKKHASRSKKKKAITSNAGGNSSETAVDGFTGPAASTTPISRADTTSASTIYAVRYHNPLSPPPVGADAPSNPQSTDADGTNANSDDSTLTNNTIHEGTLSKRTSHVDSTNGISSGRQVWQGVSNPFKRKRTEPPAEVAAQIAASNVRRSPAIQSLRSRMKNFTSKPKDRGSRTKSGPSPPQVTVIPAQRRGSRAVQLEPRSGDVADVNGALDGAHAPIPEVSEPDEEESGHDDLPVTVIPPPVRGGRTWSPDDLPAMSTSPAPSQSHTPSIIEPQSPRPSTQTQRVNSNGSLPAKPQPNRSRSWLAPSQGTPGRSSSSPSSHLQPRSLGRERGATMTSISDRLSNSPSGIPPETSTTPAAARGSGNAESTPPPTAHARTRSASSNQVNRSSTQPTLQPHPEDADTLVHDRPALPAHAENGDPSPIDDPEPTNSDSDITRRDHQTEPKPP